MSASLEPPAPANDWPTVLVDASSKRWVVRGHWEDPRRRGPAPTGHEDRFLRGSIEVLGEAALHLAILERPCRRRLRRLGTLGLATWLAGSEGEDWQQRWVSAGAEQAGRTWWQATGLDSQTAHSALATLIALRVVRPSHDWVSGNASRPVFHWFADINEPDAFLRLDAAATELGWHRDAQRRAVQGVMKIMAVTGKAMADINASDMFDYVAAANTTERGHAAHSSWQLLRHVGLLVGEESTFQAAASTGPRSVEELVDRYGVVCRPIRDLLVHYLSHRAVELDHGALTDASYHLVKLFWADLEAHHPGISSLHLPPDVAEAWKGRVRNKRARTSAMRTLLTIRAFYLDIAEWALDDPTMWEAWAAPSPVAAHDTRGHRKAMAHSLARMQARTRTLGPFLAPLARSADASLAEAAELLAATLAAVADEQFVVRGRRYRRLGRNSTRRRLPLNEFAQAKVEELFGDGRRIDVRRVEDDTFWAWAVIEVLRMTGLGLRLTSR